LFSLLIFPGFGATFFTVNIRTRGKDIDTSPLPMPQFLDAFWDFLALLAAVAIYCGVLIGVAIASAAVSSSFAATPLSIH
jgi:hypothetical protein